MIDAEDERSGHDRNAGEHHTRPKGVAEHGTEQGPADDDFGDRNDEHLGGRVNQNDRIPGGEFLANQKQSRDQSRHGDQDKNPTAVYDAVRCQTRELRPPGYRTND